MARPTKEQQKLIEIRNTLIKECVDKRELSQTDTAYIFRLPRNTVNTVLRSQKTFKEWCSQVSKEYRDDPIGDFVGDVMRDDYFPDVINDFKELKVYLSIHMTSDRLVMRAAKESWDEYTSTLL